MCSMSRLLIVLIAGLALASCSAWTPRASALPRPLPAAALQPCPEPGPAPGAEADAVAAALFDLYGLYGQCAGLHAGLVRHLEGESQ